MKHLKLSPDMMLADHDQVAQQKDAGNAQVLDPSYPGRCQSQWLTALQMRQRFRVLGFDDDIKKLHIDRIQCWAIVGSDRTGQAVEVFFHPVSGEVIELIKRDT